MTESIERRCAAHPIDGASADVSPHPTWGQVRLELRPTRKGWSQVSLERRGQLALTLPESGPRGGTPTATLGATAAGPEVGLATFGTLLRSGASGAELAAALGAGLLLDAAQLTLWEDEPQDADGPALGAGGELLDGDLVGTAR